MTTHDDGAAPFEELIRLILAPTELEAAGLLSAFGKHAVHEHHGFGYDAEMTHEEALVRTFDRDFEELAGASSEVLLSLDHNQFAEFERSANAISRQIQAGGGFEWDWEAAHERHRSGGIDPIPLAMISFDGWLKPKGFRFINFNNHGDAYLGFAARADDYERAFQLATQAGLTFIEPIRFMDAELEVSRLDSDEIRTVKLPRTFKGLDASDVRLFLGDIATRIAAGAPTQSFHIKPSRHGSLVLYRLAGMS